MEKMKKKMMKMKEMKKATQEEAVAVTSVYWDINKCPVPHGCDPCLVRASIKRLLEKNGYCGPVNVTAFGKLEDVSTDLLRGLYSSGISLTIVPHGSSDIKRLIDLPDHDANFMVISYSEACPGFSDTLKLMGYNPIQPFPYVSLDSLLMEDSGAHEIETAESTLWRCFVCSYLDSDQSFESFALHLSSAEHHQHLMLTMNTVPPPPPVDDPSMVRVMDSLMQINMPQWASLNPCTLATSSSGYDVIDWEAVESVGET